MFQYKQYVEVCYAQSSRIKCQECEQFIKKDDIKVGHVYVRRPEARFDKKIWYHLNCLRQLPKGSRNQELDVASMEKLSQQDQTKVTDKFKELRKMGYQKKNEKEGKLLSKQEHYNKFVKTPKEKFFNYYNMFKNHQNDGFDF